MINTRRITVVALAVVALLTVLPDEALAGPCTVASARTPAARAELWRQALDRFSAERPDLTAEQMQFINDAHRLGDQIATLQQNERARAIFARKAARFVDRSRELFSQTELGELFSSMGQTQIWLADLLAATPYCNCTGSGDCTFNGGPTGSCNSGCVSWDGEDGRRRDGICSAANVE